MYFKRRINNNNTNEFYKIFFFINFYKWRNVKTDN